MWQREWGHPGLQLGVMECGKGIKMAEQAGLHVHMQAGIFQGTSFCVEDHGKVITRPKLQNHWGPNILNM